MKKVLCLVMSVLLALALCACGSSNSAPDAETTKAEGQTSGQSSGSSDDRVIDKDMTVDDSGEDEMFWSDDFLRDKITIANTADAGNFSPIVKGQGWGAVNLCIFQNLLATRNDGTADLVMLKSIEQVDDLTYNLELWDFITDSKGNKFTTSDIEYCRQYYISQGMEGRAGFGNLKELEIIDDYNFVWHCIEPYKEGGFANALVAGYFWTEAAMEEVGQDDFFMNPVGTGPYALKNYVAGASINLEAVDDYWMKNITDNEWLEENLHATCIQNVKEVEFQIIQDAASRAIAIEMGTVDACSSLNAADVYNFEENPDMGISPVYLRSNSSCTFYFDVNEASPCSDVNLRKAICYALDNEAIADACSLPAYAAKNWNPLIWGTPEGYLDGIAADGSELDYYYFDQAKAKEYLDKSSYDGQTLKILYENNGITPDVAVMMKAQLEEVGIMVELLNVDKGVFDTYKLDYTMWDMLFDMIGGGCYFYDAIGKFYTEKSAETSGGMQPFGIIDEKLDELYLDVYNDGGDAEIYAWDDYAVYEQAYIYGLCGYYELTAAKTGINVVTEGKMNALTPGAFTFDD